MLEGALTDLLAYDQHLRRSGLRANRGVRQRIRTARLRRQLRALYLNRCHFGPAECRGKLNFIHLIPNGLHGEGRGLRRRLFDIQHHPFLYALACVKHHRAYDLARDPSTAGTPIHSSGLKWFTFQQEPEKDNSEGGVVA